MTQDPRELPEHGRDGGLVIEGEKQWRYFLAHATQEQLEAVIKQLRAMRKGEDGKWR
jgi:hypothetical protein